jgi:ABC-type antimicrobial peptide transport system permease subunit
MYIDDFSFSWNVESIALVIIIAFFVMAASAYVASKKIYKMDPIEDLQK